MEETQKEPSEEHDLFVFHLRQGERHAMVIAMTVAQAISAVTALDDEFDWVLEEASLIEYAPHVACIFHPHNFDRVANFGLPDTNNGVS